MKETLPDLIKNASLCYVRGNFAFFTTQNLEEQDGDFWEHHNFDFYSGEPHNVKNHSIVKLCFDKGYVFKDSDDYSVKDMNSKKQPWIISNSGHKIFAGTSLADFIKETDLEIYLPKIFPLNESA